MKELIKKLNEASHYYYNTGNTIMSDAEFDALLEKLKRMEEETGIVMSNSPTKNVGAPPIVDKIDEVEHETPMLSLDKVHSVEEVMKFAGNNECIAMLKMDGLSIRAIYESGKLLELSTRGNGVIGKNVLHLASAFENLPLEIKKDGTYIIDGEAIIKLDDFAKINAEIKNEDDKYKNARNLAAGTLGLHDCSEARKRYLKFIAWDIIDGSDKENVSERLIEAIDLGFNTVPCSLFDKEMFGSNEDAIDCIYSLRDYAEQINYPIDGVVVKINNVKYGKSLGRTEKFFRNAVAYKFEDEIVETLLTDIEWSCGKTGVITPIGLFSPVEIEGTTVERASLCNISVMKELWSRQWHSGLTVGVSKRNQIIPKIEYVIHNVNTEAKRLDLPNTCPECNAPTEIRKDGIAEVLYCTNPNCKGRLLGKLSHSVSKNALNIDGLSEASIEKFINYGWLNSIKDVYHLSDYADKMKKLDGFGLKSVNKLLTNIEKSRKTTLDKFLYSLSIPLVGKTASKAIAKYCHNSVDEFIFITSNTILEFASIPGIGTALVNSLADWWDSNAEMFHELIEEFEFDAPEENKKTDDSSNILDGKTFCITGKLEHYKNRDSLVKEIETFGGKYVSSVTKNTDYLINNDKTSASSKNKKAAQVGCEIISEADFMQMCNAVDVTKN